MAESQKSITYSLGGHETFVFRYNWLKKGLDALTKDPTVFSRDDALVTLGVGKNMVRSIRHWCLALGLAEESASAKSSRSLQPTSLGKQLLADGGWDPYLEDIGSLWLLHWQIATRLDRGLVWHIAFSEFLEPEFNKRQLEEFISQRLSRFSVHTTERVLRREVDCCLRTYVSSSQNAKTQKKGKDLLSEESFDCPLVELDLIRYFSEDGMYHINVGPKTSLPVAVFGYALWIFWQTWTRTAEPLLLMSAFISQAVPDRFSNWMRVA